MILFLKQERVEYLKSKAVPKKASKSPGAPYTCDQVQPEVRIFIVVAGYNEGLRKRDFPAPWKIEAGVGGISVLKPEA